MPQSALRQTVRDRLASGWLFPVPHRVWAGKGTEHVCIVCGTTIAPSEVENEVVGPTTVWSHLPCYSIWREESQAYELANSADGADGTDGSRHLADLRQTVRERFANRRLFVLPHDKSWAGRGKSDICAVCSKPIFAAESSQEVIGVPQSHAHLVCYRAWLELTRFRGHPMVGAERSIHDAEEPSAVRAGVPAADRRVGPQGADT